MKRRFRLVLLVLVLLLVLSPAMALAESPSLQIDSVTVEPSAIRAGTEAQLSVQSVEPEGATWQKVEFMISSPGSTNATLTLDGMLFASSPGIVTVKVRFYDELGGFIDREVQITVFEPIEITTPSSLPDGQVDVSYTVDLEATGSPASWDVVSELPPGLTFVDNGASATIEGTPTVSGTYQIDVDAANNDMVAHASFSIQIAAAATPTPIPTPISPPTPIPSPASTSTSPTGSDPTASDASGSDLSGTDPSATGTDAPQPVAYKMTQQPPAWIKGSQESASFTSDADFSDFMHVKVDSTVVDESNYDAGEGSTIITFKPAFLERLSVGDHPVEIASVHGSAYGNLQIKAKSGQKTAATTNPGDTLPRTGRGSGYSPWLAFLLITASGVIFLAGRKRRSQQSD